MRLLPLLVLSLAAAAPTYADILFPAESVRPQGNARCWAYGAARVLETRLQRDRGILAPIDLEAGVLYWQVYDQLMAAHEQSKAPESLGEEGGFSAEFFELFLRHGLVVNFSRAASPQPSFSFPIEFNRPLPFLGPEADEFDSTPEPEEMRLFLAATGVNAEGIARHITQAGFRAPPRFFGDWLGQSVDAADTRTRYLGADWLKAHTFRDFVLLSGALAEENPKSHADAQAWVKYDDDRYLAYAEPDFSKILTAVRRSLDGGWPTTIETPTHVMAILGYATSSPGEYSYAVGDGYHWKGVRWMDAAALSKMGAIDATVFRPVLGDLLPEVPEERGIPSVLLPRRR